MTKYIYILLFFLPTFKVVAQYPQHFTYDTENGLPSNEVYSIVQDQKGFIWIGCDAGLFKFDGVRYIRYKCKTQTSKAIDDLTLSSSGKLYCHNFSGQLFCLENDQLKELKHPIPVPETKINDLVSDTKGNIYVNHWSGVVRYNEQTKKWKEFFKYDSDSLYVSTKYAVHTNKGSKCKTVTAVYFKGIGTILDKNIKPFHKTDLFRKIGSGEFEIVDYHNTFWLFAKEKRTIYRYANHKLEQIVNTKLNKVLDKRRINNIKILPDNKMWICTYKGIVCFNPKNNSVQLFYPELSFSDCLIDREHNYWFTTLFTGVYRVTDLKFKVWQEYDKLTKITHDGTHIYFADIKGNIGKLNVFTNELRTFVTGSNANVQSLDYDPEENALYFNVDNCLLKLKDDKIQSTHNNITGIKSFYKINRTKFTASSIGIFIDDKLIDKNWAREITFDDVNRVVWVATNIGLFKMETISNEWKITQTFFNETQIISIDFDKASQKLFAITFDGKVYSITPRGKVQFITSLPADAQVNRVKYNQGILYIGSNKGFFSFRLSTKRLLNFNVLSGLASDNFQDITIVNNCLWVATGKGLQQIPLNRLKQQKPRAQIYLRSNPDLNVNLDYGKPLVLFPEVSAYNSNGQFQYAYRINKNKWIKLPANIEQIEIQNLPAGTIEIQLKAIDYLGRDSENTIVLKGYVAPPFYKTWWFIAIIILFLAGLFYWFYKRQLAKQQRELKRQNEVNLAKLIAIRSQMNPHFIFNSLNSIQDLILQKKTIESYDYVVTFSELVRNTLIYSNRDFISIREEIDFLDTYLQLEQLRFKEDFHYQISYNGTDDIDVPSLLIQPFVENALFHGLLHKAGKKELRICFTFSEETLICTIEDNGIGRKKAAVIGTRQGYNHESFALEAIQKRMDIFNEQQEKTISEFTFEDVSPHLEDTGTRVNIRLPFKRHY